MKDLIHGSLFLFNLNQHVSPAFVIADKNYEIHQSRNYVHIVGVLRILLG
jgi:hypothetical protein